MALFEFGSLSFFILLVAEFVICLALAYSEYFGWDYILLFATLFFYRKNLSEFSWKVDTGILFVFLLLGLIYSYIKWCTAVKKIVKTAKEENRSKDFYQEAIRVSNYANQRLIVKWLSLWPFFLFWDLTANLFSNIFEMFRGLYERVSQRGVLEIERHYESERQKKQEKG